MLIFVKIKLALSELKSMIEPDLKGMPYTYSPRPIPPTSSQILPCWELGEEQEEQI